MPRFLILNANNYGTITEASSVTATRDLANLAGQGALIRLGERKYAQYELSIPLWPFTYVSINERDESVGSQDHPASRAG